MKIFGTLCIVLLCAVSLVTAGTTGKIAGEVAAGFIKGQTTLDSYRLRVNSEFGRELERSVRIRRMVDVVMRSDRLMDALIGALDPDQMKSIMRGQIPSAFGAVHDLLGKIKY